MWGECISGALYKGDFTALAKAVGFADPRILSSSPIAINDAAMKELLGATRFYSITYRLFKLPGLLEPACEDYGQVAIYKVCHWSSVQCLLNKLEWTVDPQRQALIGFGGSLIATEVQLSEEHEYPVIQHARSIFFMISRQEPCLLNVQHTQPLCMRSRRMSNAKRAFETSWSLQGSIEGCEHEYVLDDGHVFEKGRPALVCGNTAAMLGEDSVSWLSKHFQV